MHWLTDGLLNGHSPKLANSPVGFLAIAGAANPSTASDTAANARRGAMTPLPAWGMPILIILILLSLVDATKRRPIQLDPELELMAMFISSTYYQSTGAACCCYRNTTRDGSIGNTTPCQAEKSTTWQRRESSNGPYGEHQYVEDRLAGIHT